MSLDDTAAGLTVLARSPQWRLLWLVALMAAPTFLISAPSHTRRPARPDPDGALAAEPPSRDLTIALQAAREYELSVFQTTALWCIRQVERGGPGREYGVLHPDAVGRSHLIQARWAAGSIRKRLPNQSALPIFASRWAPVDADNDPDGLNQFWLRNMQGCLSRWQDAPAGAASKTARTPADDAERSRSSSG